MHNKTILITGGTGSWGYELVHQLLLRKPKEIRIFSRNEALQAAMRLHFDGNTQIRYYIGDVKDKQDLMLACQGVDELYHLAALKHVPVCEHQPDAAFKTNVIGTQNVIDAAILNQLKKVIYVSTDKASSPSNTYGMTKALAERLIIHANTRETKTRFVCVRSGNVLGSTGSVIPIFKHQLHHRAPLSVTDKRMTRFFASLENAIRLLIQAAEESVGGEIFVMKMAASKIIDIALILMEQEAQVHSEIKETGIRAGEQLGETLISESESLTTLHYDEKSYVILPNYPITGLQCRYADYEAVSFTGYHSNDYVMSKTETKHLLQGAKLL